MYEWLYFRIYPGSLALGDLALPSIIAPALAMAREQPGIQRWFFIRYLDDSGPHLRLRFKGTVAAINSLYGRLASFLKVALPPLREVQPPALQRLIPWKFGDGTETSNGPHFVLDIYEPEFEKYGGPVGLDIAETLFETSSDLALNVLCKGPTRISERAVLAVCLMIEAATSAVAAQRWSAFWQYYSWFWTGGESASGQTLRSHLQAAADRRLSVLQGECRQLCVSDEGHTLIEAYRVALDQTFTAVRVAGVGVPEEQLCFHYVHMMNNRLGIFPIEEAYLAQLLQSSGNGWM